MFGAERRMKRWRVVRLKQVDHVQARGLSLAFAKLLKIYSVYQQTHQNEGQSRLQKVWSFAGLGTGTPQVHEHDPG